HIFPGMLGCSIFAKSNILSQDLQSGFPAVLILPKPDPLLCNRLRTSAAAFRYPTHPCAKVNGHFDLQPSYPGLTHGYSHLDSFRVLSSVFASALQSEVATKFSNLTIFQFSNSPIRKQDYRLPSYSIHHEKIGPLFFY